MFREKCLFKWDTFKWKYIYYVHLKTTLTCTPTKYGSISVSILFVGIWKAYGCTHGCTLNSFIQFFPLICNLTSPATVQRMPRTSKPLSEISVRTAGEAHHVSLRTWCCESAGTTGKHLYPHLFLFLMDQQDVRRVICLLLCLTVYAGWGKVDLQVFIWKII